MFPNLLRLLSRYIQEGKLLHGFGLKYFGVCEKSGELFAQLLAIGVADFGPCR